jgi:hypothetical protein
MKLKITDPKSKKEFTVTARVGCGKIFIDELEQSFTLAEIAKVRVAVLEANMDELAAYAAFSMPDFSTPPLPKPRNIRY